MEWTALVSFNNCVLYVVCVVLHLCVETVVVWCREWCGLGCGEGGVITVACGVVCFGVLCVWRVGGMVWRGMCGDWYAVTVCVCNVVLVLLYWHSVRVWYNVVHTIFESPPRWQTFSTYSEQWGQNIRYSSSMYSKQSGQSMRYSSCIYSKQCGQMIKYSWLHYP